MSLVQRLDLRQSQQLVMTPQLQQAIKLLQLSNLELASFVEGELAQNPLLEAPDTDGPDGDPGEPESVAGPAAGEPAPLTDLTGDTAVAGGEPPLDVEPDAVWADAGDGDGASGPGGAAGAGAGAGEDGYDPLANATGRSTLRDHLESQIGCDLHDPGDRLIAAAFLDALDEAGYLTTAPETIAATLGGDPAQARRVLERLQRCDPAGVFARDLAECLALQLADRDRLDPAMQALLRHLPLLAERRWPELMAICRVDAEDLADMVREIRALDPKPGLSFESQAADTIVPDILLRRERDGSWGLELNPDTLPRVLINRRYHALVAGAARTKHERDYLTERLNAASWLVRALDQRATTILKVAGEIVRRQEAFFERGVAGLKPLILRDIAEAIGMHESTVSRVTSNKYMATPRGLFELKYFFTTAIASADGDEAVSAEAVRHRIRGLIDGEAPNAILSDDRIVDLLREGGIDIARRTVAKYREQMHIPGSVQRRREKAAGAPAGLNGRAARG